MRAHATALPAAVPSEVLPDPAILPAVRSQVEQGLEHLTIACRLLRENGWPENADELMRTVKHGRVWTMPGGWLDHLAPAPAPGREVP